MAEASEKAQTGTRQSGAKRKQDDKACDCITWEQLFANHPEAKEGPAVKFSDTAKRCYGRVRKRKSGQGMGLMEARKHILGATKGFLRKRKLDALIKTEEEAEGGAEEPEEEGAKAKAPVKVKLEFL